MNFCRFQLLFLVGIIHTCFALECYKCPVDMRDVFHCSDPFENRSFKRTCEKEEDVCLKVSVRGGSNHLEERGCANRKTVDTICNRVKQNFLPEDVICAVCETDLCNASQRRDAASLLYILLLSFIIIFMYKG
ncbi:uncharacterized protein LOC111874337 [Cryptotermes secundus]|uniref:uncharacterized protein LOC111874337 n=1 Tax=Cryptotermes secundus TaxID=105785 RepID=UPI000CD7D208|nr:uncharacterized protein LOC111874337 [Cryptotermes secundus]